VCTVYMAPLLPCAHTSDVSVTSCSHVMWRRVSDWLEVHAEVKCQSEDCAARSSSFVSQCSELLSAWCDAII